VINYLEGDIAYFMQMKVVFGAQMKGTTTPKICISLA
jgi:hypothetical protein